MLIMAKLKINTTLIQRYLNNTQFYEMLHGILFKGPESATICQRCTTIQTEGIIICGGADGVMIL